VKPEVLLLALGSTVDPLMMTVVVVILSRPRANLSLACYLAGGFLASAALCVALVEGLRGVGFKGLDELPPGVRIGLGALLVAGAIVVYWRTVHQESISRETGFLPWAVGRVERAGPLLAFGIGAVANLPGGYTLIAMATIAQSHPPVEVALLQILVFNLIMFLPAEIPLVARLVAPDAADRVIGGLRGWMTRNGPKVALVVIVVVGTALAVTGISDAAA